jgi:hypothetical protein
MKYIEFIFLATAMTIIALFLSRVSFGQTSIIGNNSVNTNDFVGWDGAPTFDLDIKHEGNRRIVFGTGGTDHFGVLSSSEDGKVVYNTFSPIDDARLSIRSNFPLFGVNIAVRSTAGNQFPSFGGYFTSTGTSVVSNAGVFGNSASSASQENFGIVGFACGLGAARNYAVYGLMKPECTGWAGYFNGPTFTPGAAWSSSDSNLKLNTQNLESGLNLIQQLYPKTYNFNQSVDYLNLPEETQYGLLAQDLEAVLPNAVKEAVGSNIDQDGSFTFKAVNYQQLIPILVRAFQERQTAIEQQQALIHELEEQIAIAEIQLNEISGN